MFKHGNRDNIGSSAPAKTSWFQMLQCETVDTLLKPFIPFDDLLDSKDEPQKLLPPHPKICFPQSRQRDMIIMFKNWKIS